MLCKVCSGDSQPFGSARLIGKYDVQYYQCPQCGFVQTEEPYWLEEVYREPITHSDIGMVQRNLWLAAVTKALVVTFFNPQGKFLDYGGGYGLFVRLMRDGGLDFYRYDKHCANLFAQEFDADIDADTDQPGQSGRYELLTAFELLEHLVNPREEIDRMLAFSPNLLISTVLLPQSNPKPGGWWYYGLEHGQHVSLYTRKSLEQIAAQHGLHLLSNGSTLHLLTPQRIAPLAFRVVTSSRVAKIVGKRYRKSLQAADFYRVSGQRIG